MDENSMSYPVGPGGQAVYFSATGPTQATITVASSIPIPGALYQVIGYNPNGVASNPVTFTVTNTIQKPAFLNPGPQTFVGGGSFNIIQTATSAGIAWTISPTTAVTLTSASDTGVAVNVSTGIPISSPTNYTLSATDSASQTTSQTFTIQNTFVTPAFANPGTKNFTNGGSFSVSQTAINTGQLTWTITPTTGMTLTSASTSGVTVNVDNATPIAGVTYSLTATNPTPSSCVQSFSVTNTLSALYPFTAFTFTPIGATGASGPTSLAGYGTSYPGYGTSYALTLSGGIQIWTVPISGNYTITIAGAAGGTDTGGSATGGNGVVFTITVALTISHSIKILVGQQGTNGLESSSLAAGGGGGTFVYNNTTSVLIAAGGAGGGAGVKHTAASYLTSMNGKDGSLTTPGLTGYSNPSGQWTGGSGGTSGNGGGVGSNLYGGAGAGYSGNGSPSSSQTSPNNALAFLNGGTGYIAGGFGGGGTEAFGGAGGGGGYSGGGGGGSDKDGLGGAGGGGGGSYSINGTISSGTLNSGTGYVTITKV